MAKPAKNLNPTPSLAQVAAPAPVLPPGPSPVPAPPAKTDAEWTCQIRGASEELTVGSKFNLVCEGPSVALDGKHLSLELPQEAKHALRLLETKSLTENRAEFVATSWMSGELKLASVTLSDGSKRVGLGELKFTVASVLDPKSNPEMKPYPPWSSLAMAWPLWIWFAFMLLVAALAGWIGLRMRRTLRRKRLLRLLEKNPIALSPFHQFNKDLRRLARTVPADASGWDQAAERNYFREVDQALRWLLARELVIATFERAPRDINRDLKRTDARKHKALHKDLSLVMNELAQAQSGQHRLPINDVLQITELARSFADRVHALGERPS